jgi:threonine dehydratase
MSGAVDLSAVRAAAARIAPHVHRTPVLTSRSLDARAGRSLYFKAEPFQRGGSFKLRGALNAVLCLPEDQAARGVLTHSSGNFAAALAIAAGIRGVPCHVVMPEDAVPLKVAAVRSYGGEVVFCAPHARAETAARLQARTGATFLPSYDHPDVIAGQGTLMLELLEQAPPLDAVLVQVGGGGLIGGVAVVARAHGLRVFGAEPRAVDDAARSLSSGVRQPPPTGHTRADGLRTGLGDHTWPLLQQHVEAVLTVGEAEIEAATQLCWHRLKVVVEPSGAVGLAAALGGLLPPELGRLGLVLSGGNADLG